MRVLETQKLEIKNFPAYSSPSDLLAEFNLALLDLCRIRRNL